MIIYYNDDCFKQELQNLLEDHHLEPLWLREPHPKMNLVFLSVHDKTELAQIRQRYQGPLVLSIEDEENIHDYLSYQPFYILRKEHNEEDMVVLKRLLRQYFEETYATIPIKMGSSTLHLAISSINYVESFSHYLTLHTRHGEYTLRQNMQSLQAQLRGFIRVHKSYLVAICQIAQIQSTQLILKDNTVIPVGRAYKKELSSLELF